MLVLLGPGVSAVSRMKYAAVILGDPSGIDIQRENAITIAQFILMLFGLGVSAVRAFYDRVVASDRPDIIFIKGININEGLIPYLKA